MTIYDRAIEREISEILHFTTKKGILGVIATSCLKSRPLLNEDDYLEYVLELNWESRPEEAADFDKSEDWIRYVNLSVSEINRRLFEFSMSHHADLWWGILSFSPEILDHAGVYFTTTNNGYDACNRNVGIEGFEAMFESPVRRKHVGMQGRPWICSRSARGTHLTTCEQAEVLYPEAVSVEYLQRIYVSEPEHSDLVLGWLGEFGLPDVEVVTNARKFIGQKN